MIKIIKLKFYNLIIGIIAYPIIAAFLCQNVVWAAKFGLSSNALSAPSCFSGYSSRQESDKERKDWGALVSEYKAKIEGANSQAELKNLWRSMVMDVHPDHNPEDNEEANEAFKILKEAIEERTKAGFAKVAEEGDISGLPLWVYDLDFYEKERDGISGVEIMAILEKQKKENSRDMKKQIDLVESLVVGEILHVELPVDISTRRPAATVDSRALEVPVETTVIRVMVLKSLSGEGILEVIPIETPFYGGRYFTPRVNISSISMEDLLSRRVTIIREPLQVGDFSVKIGDQVEIFLYGPEWIGIEPFWAKATVVSNAWGSFTMVAHDVVHKNKQLYAGMGITLNRHKAEEGLAGGSLMRIVTPPHINSEMAPETRYDYSLTIDTAFNINRFETVVSEVIKTIQADSSHALHGLDLDELEVIVEKKVRATLVQEFKSMDDRFDTGVSWHRVNRYTADSLRHQKQVYPDSMFFSQEAPFSALLYLGGIALDRVQFGENYPRYPIEKSKQVEAINIEDADNYFNQHFQADSENICVCDYHVIAATNNNAIFDFQKDGGDYPLRALQRFIDSNPGPYQLIKYDYSGMLDDYERDGFYLESSEPLLPFQELPEDLRNEVYFQEQCRRNIEYMQGIYAETPDFYCRVFEQVIDHVYNMIAAGLHMDTNGWRVSNWHITPDGEVKLFRLETFKIVGATNHIMPYVSNMAEAIIEWIIDFRKMFRDVDPQLEERFVTILKEKPGLFYHGEAGSTSLMAELGYTGKIEVPDPDFNKRKMEELKGEIEDTLHYKQRNTLKKRKAMKPVPVLIPETSNLYRLRDKIVQELDVASPVDLGDPDRMSGELLGAV